MGLVLVRLSLASRFVTCGWSSSLEVVPPRFGRGTSFYRSSMHDTKGEFIMAKILRGNSMARKLGLLAVAAALFGAAMIGNPRPAHPCQMWTDYFTYFS